MSDHFEVASLMEFILDEVEAAVEEDRVQDVPNEGVEVGAKDAFDLRSIKHIIVKERPLDVCRMKFEQGDGDVNVTALNKGDYTLTISSLRKFDEKTLQLVEGQINKDEEEMSAWEATQRSHSAPLVLVYNASSHPPSQCGDLVLQDFLEEDNIVWRSLWVPMPPVCDEDDCEVNDCDEDGCEEDDCDDDCEEDDCEMDDCDEDDCDDDCNEDDCEVDACGVDACEEVTKLNGTGEGMDQVKKVDASTSPSLSHILTKQKSTQTSFVQNEKTTKASTKTTNTSNSSCFGGTIWRKIWKCFQRK